MGQPESVLEFYRSTAEEGAYFGLGYSAHYEGDAPAWRPPHQSLTSEAVVLNQAEMSETLGAAVADAAERHVVGL